LEKKVNVANHQCQALYYTAKGVPVVFLHGLSYTNEIWQRLNVTDLLMQKRIPFLALDMPYGMRSQCQPRTRDPKKNIEFTNEAVKSFFGSEVPVLVGASIGGHMALRYAAQFAVKGLFLVAPARALGPDLVSTFSQFKFPITIVWGSEDNIIGGEEMRTLADKLPNAKLIIYEGANHSAYKDQPDRFKHDLLEFYAKAEQTRT
jgi:pimeloyl-ACP methyl ester carboxylesterase